MYLCRIVLVVSCVQVSAPAPADRSVVDNIQTIEFPHCGVTSAFVALRILGRQDISWSDVKARFIELAPDCDLEEVSLYQIRKVVESYGLHAMSMRVDMTDPKSVPTPAIFYISPNRLGDDRIGHVAVLISINNQGAEICDLTLSKENVWIPQERLQRVWDGEMLAVSDEPIRLASTLTSIVYWVVNSVILSATMFLMLKGFTYKGIAT